MRWSCDARGLLSRLVSTARRPTNTWMAQIASRSFATNISCVAVESFVNKQRKRDISWRTRDGRTRRSKLMGAPWSFVVQPWWNILHLQNLPDFGVEKTANNGGFVPHLYLEPTVSVRSWTTCIILSESCFCRLAEFHLRNFRKSFTFPKKLRSEAVDPVQAGAEPLLQSCYFYSPVSKQG